MSVDPVRAEALDLLVRVQSGQPLEPHLGRAQTQLNEPRDRNLLGELVRGSLQWQGRYDAVIGRLVQKRPPRDPRLVCLLRLALHQLLGMNGIPPRAAVHQAGELCRAKVSPRLVGFVNGTLQTARRTLLGSWDPTAAGGQPDPRPEALHRFLQDLVPDTPTWLAAWHSHPRWLIQRWLDRYGLDATEAMCRVNNAPLKPVLQVLDLDAVQGVAEELASMGLKTTPVHDAGLQPLRRLSRREWDDLLEHQPGLIVQDPVVREATRWLAEILPVPQGNATPRLLDLCAAPGGKTALLATGLTGWRIVAADHRLSRVRMLDRTLRRTRLEAVGRLVADGTHPPFAAGAFEAVLLDGPCSGSGVLRHHPEGRWRLQPETLASNGTRLLKLASEAADLLAPGGSLLYATCSLEPEENERVLNALLAQDSRLLPVGDPWYRTWTPDETGGDGFFAARLRRRTEGESTERESK